MDIFIVINKELDESNFNLLTSWLIREFTFFFVFSNKNISVGNNRFLNNVLNLIGNFKFSWESISVLWTVSHMISWVWLSGDLIFTNDHSTFGYASSLSDSNFVAHAHVLNTFNVFDQDLFTLQSVDGEWHGERNG